MTSCGQKGVASNGFADAAPRPRIQRRPMRGGLRISTCPEGLIRLGVPALLPLTSPRPSTKARPRRTRYHAAAYAINAHTEDLRRATPHCAANRTKKTDASSTAQDTVKDVREVMTASTLSRKVRSR